MTTAKINNVMIQYATRHEDGTVKGIMKLSNGILTWSQVEFTWNEIENSLHLHDIDINTGLPGAYIGKGSLAINAVINHIKINNI